MRRSAAEGAGANGQATSGGAGSVRGGTGPTPVGHNEDIAVASDTRRNAERRRSYAAHITAFLIVAIGALDCVSTNLAIGTGFAQELNPIVAWIQAALGPYWVWPKMAIHALLAAVLLAHPTRPALIAMGVVAALTLVAAVNNLAIYQNYSGLAG